MLERYITALATEASDLEGIPLLKERLKSRLPAGATRRMTLLGMLVGSMLEELKPVSGEPIVYASEFGESRTLEGYLDSFPSASPTLFQTSIHPSAVQQGMIFRQRETGEFFPMAGSPALPAFALRTALLSEAPRVLFCGGEERASWLTEHGMASASTYAYALALSKEPGDTPLGKIELAAAEGDGALDNDTWFALLQHRKPFLGVASIGLEMRLSWE